MQLSVEEGQKEPIFNPVKLVFYAFFLRRGNGTEYFKIHY
jgi:hypothetical protein